MVGFLTSGLMTRRLAVYMISVWVHCLSRMVWYIYTENLHLYGLRGRSLGRVYGALGGRDHDAGVSVMSCFWNALRSCEEGVYLCLRGRKAHSY
jgi:hypothetical protein